MKSNKLRILLIWGYHRKGWLHAFNALRDDFDFYYLFHISKPENEVNHSGSSNILYWSDFSSAQDIINRIKPDKIVFMGIESLPTIALNVVAKSRKIETLVVQHGMFHRYSDYLNWAVEEMKERKRTGQFSQSAVEIDRFFLLRFFLRSVSLTNPLVILYMAKFQYLKRRYLEVEAVKNAPSEFRTASKYVVFTRDNASIYCERDRIAKEDLIEIGNPEMDAYFNYKLKLENKENYYLLIDEPWSEMKDYASPGYGISKEQTNDFHKKLANFAEKHSAKLKIKLHPYSYDSDFLPSHPNIEYLRDVDTVELILNSNGVFGFSSTLTLPAIYFNKCCLFKIWEQSSYQNDIKESKLAQVLDYYSFNETDINFDYYRKNEKNINYFVEKYFHKADGCTIQRLKKVLQKDAVQ